MEWDRRWVWLLGVGLTRADSGRMCRNTNVLLILFGRFLCVCVCFQIWAKDSKRMRSKKSVLFFAGDVFGVNPIMYANPYKHLVNIAIFAKISKLISDE